MFRRTPSDPSKRFFPLLGLVAAAGVALGVMSLIVVICVMQGFNDEVGLRLIGLNSHITISSKDNSKLPPLQEVEAVLGDQKLTLNEVIKGEAVVKSFVNERPVAAGAEIRGIDELPSSRMMSFGLAPSAKWDEGAILGKDLLDVLSVYPSLNDSLEIVAPMAEVGPTGDLVPRRKKMTLSGMFESGIYRYDSGLVFLSKKQAASVLGMQARPVYEIMLKDASKSSLVAKWIKDAFPNFEVTTWEESNKRLFAALRLERMATGAMLFLTILISSFSIAGATSMFVSARRKDAAILWVLGLKKNSMRAIFMAQGVAVGLLGSISGVLLGVIACVILSKWQISLPDVYYLDHLPVKINPTAIAGFAFLSIFLSAASSWLPVRSVLKDDTVSALRYE